MTMQVETKQSVVAKTLMGSMLVALMSMANLAQAELKIAIVDVQRAAMSSNKAKQANDQLKEKFGADEEKVKSLAKEIKALQERAKKDSAILSEDEKKQLMSKLEEKGVNYQFLGKKLQKAVQEKQRDFIQSILPKVNEAVNTIAKKKKVDLVIRREAVLLMNDDVEDITEQVTAELNKAS